MTQQDTSRVDNRRTDTRDRILQVALRLFADNGYAATSLQKIADELGVTKAALYFHFKTKEDILGGILLGHRDSVDDMVNEVGPRLDTPEGREELLRLISAYQATRSQYLIRLIRENSVEIGNLTFGAQIRAAQHRLFDALAGPDATLLDRMRARTAFVALHMAVKHGEDLDATDDELREAALTVALDVLRGIDRPPGT
ncbi:TetR/AcrR family transcriptional regulator [Catenuloplanes japonicus]|uniref:TetR/AcrR family transcriptional regulator n=1 Tax=Catenuloplanes japonicus TaxID=33876 RepID=UPI000525D7FC|nr:TetR/AcrR family transcriptional regulator [Catenuloplanes japonicus]